MNLWPNMPLYALGLRVPPPVQQFVSIGVPNDVSFAESGSKLDKFENDLRFGADHSDWDTKFV